ncbi:MAG: hypothetical protein ACRDY1_04425 [Acidimicrobiales bacterium]
MPGFVVRGTAHTAVGAGAWVRRVEDESGKEAARDIGTLKAAGFEAGAYVDLRPEAHAASGAGGSTVLLFATAAGARRQVKVQYDQGVAVQGSGVVIRPLKVGLTGARAFSTLGSGPRRAGASNAYVASGRCLFVVGDFLAGTRPATAHPVVVGARSLARRATGVCAGRPATGS